MGRDKKKEKQDSFTEEYQKLMKSSDKTTFIIPRQWNDEGDSIQKFSLYENYTPVMTSGDTTLNV